MINSLARFALVFFLATLPAISATAQEDDDFNKNLCRRDANKDHRDCERLCRDERRAELLVCKFPEPDVRACAKDCIDVFDTCSATFVDERKQCFADCREAGNAAVEACRAALPDGVEKCALDATCSTCVNDALEAERTCGAACSAGFRQDRIDAGCYSALVNCIDTCKATNDDEENSDS